VPRAEGRLFRVAVRAEDSKTNSEPAARGVLGVNGAAADASGASGCI